MKRILTLIIILIISMKCIHAQKRFDLDVFGITYPTTFYWAGGGGLMVNYELVPNWWVGTGALYVVDHGGWENQMGDNDPNFFNITRLQFRLSREFNIFQSLTKISPFIETEFNHYALESSYTYQAVTLNVGLILEFSLSSRLAVLTGVKFFDLTGVIDDDIIAMGTIERNFTVPSGGSSGTGNNTVLYVSNAGNRLEGYVYNRSIVDLMLGISINIFKKKEL